MVSLPEGGGAISGLGEKFAADLQTGTGNFSVPIAVPSGRAGLTPSMSLQYSAGSGQSEFGLGWNVPVTAGVESFDGMSRTLSCP